VSEPSATDPEGEDNNMLSTNISFWPKKEIKTTQIRRRLH